MKPGMIALTGATSATGVALLAYTTRDHTMKVLGMPPIQNISPPATVSIVIKNLNEAEYLPRCIESLLNQSIMKRYPGYFEILLVDGNSNDQSVEIAERYPIKVKITQRGILHQMNEGIKNTSGEIVVFVDSDSFYPEYWLEKMLDFFDEDTSMVHTSFIHEKSDNVVLPLGNLIKSLTGVANGGGQAMWRSALDEAGYFDESQDCVYAPRVFQEAEINVVSRMSSVGKVKYQWDNPFITTNRRLVASFFPHECVRNPGSPNCKFSQEIGVTRF